MQRNAPASVADAVLSLGQSTVHNVMAALKSGLGVEDIAVEGIATEAEARDVIAALRQSGFIGRFYKSARRANER